MRPKTDLAPNERQQKISHSVRSIGALTKWLMVLLLFWVALFFSWTTLSCVDFMYPMLYKQIEIGASIDKFGPQNRYKKDFALTSRAERESLFSQIVVAINHNGEGLEDMVYHNPQGQVIDKLLRPAEVVHLKDVAVLLATLRYVTVVASLILILVLIYWWKAKPKIGFPSVKAAFGGMLVLSVFSTLMLTLIGPTKIFYWLHTKIFPADHQWFFYYQDSLMTTLMKAPDIFAYIAILLVVLAWAYFAILVALVRRLTVA